MEKDKKLAQIFHFDLYGKRQEKYNFLDDNTLSSVQWTELQPAAPDYFFVPKDFSLKEEYEKGFKIDELFTVNSSGVKTHNDDELVNFNPFPENNQRYSYRPFDVRFINYDLKKVVRHRFQVMQHFLKGENVGLCLMRSLIDTEILSSVYVTINMMDINFYRFQSYIFPLYLYYENFGQTEKVVNMNEAILRRFAAMIDPTGQMFIENNQQHITHSTPSGSNNTGIAAVSTNMRPVGSNFAQQIFDYIYAVLHSSLYREKYKEFLKIDFPRIPYPENAEQFKNLANFGEKLRKLHLMENVEPQKDMANFPVSGTNEIEKPEYIENKVFINSIQYFDNVPQTAWEFYIGGYQPAQKWLKDRKGRKLAFDDVRHYQKIIAILVETEKTMKAIDVN